MTTELNGKQGMSNVLLRVGVLIQGYSATKLIKPSNLKFFDPPSDCDDHDDLGTEDVHCFGILGSGPEDD